MVDVISNEKVAQQELPITKRTFKWPHLNKNIEEVKLSLSKSIDAFKEIGNNLNNLLYKGSENSFSKNATELVSIPFNLIKGACYLAIGAIKAIDSISSFGEDVKFMLAEGAAALTKLDANFSSSDTLQQNISHITGFTIDKTTSDALVEGYKITTKLAGNINMFNLPFAAPEAVKFASDLYNASKAVEAIYANMTLPHMDVQAESIQPIGETTCQNY